MAVKNNINRQLNGLNPLSYIGDNPYTPGNMNTVNRDPNSNDSKGYDLGDFWLNTDNETIWYLANLDGNIATWLPFGLGQIETITGNSGGPVGPDSNQNINVITANATVKFVGDPVTFTETQDFGLSNLVLGASAASAAGTANTGLGKNALASITSAVNNTAVGFGALTSDTTASNNTAVGNLALAASISGGNNVAVGERALTGLTTGTVNTAVGYNAGKSITTSTGSTALGANALDTFTTGAANVGSNTAIGDGALHLLTTGSLNTALGIGSLQNLLTGNNNISIGSLNAAAQPAGNAYTTTESSNILIGSPGVIGDNNTIRIGAEGATAGAQNTAYMAGIYNTALLGRVVNVDSNGKLGANDFSAIDWTPTLAFGGSSVGITYAVQEGHYQALGNMVFFAGGIVLTNKGAQVGTATIGGLPFASSGANNVQLGVQAISSVTLPAGRTYVWCAVLAGTTTIVIEAGGSAVAQIDLTDAEFANNSAISFSGFYFRV